MSLIFIRLLSHGCQPSPAVTSSQGCQPSPAVTLMSALDVQPSCTPPSLKLARCPLAHMPVQPHAKPHLTSPSPASSSPAVSVLAFVDLHLQPGFVEDTPHLSLRSGSFMSCIATVISVSPRRSLSEASTHNVHSPTHLACSICPCLHRLTSAIRPNTPSCIGPTRRLVSATLVSLTIRSSHLQCA
jgi:hypothetical protein